MSGNIPRPLTPLLGRDGDVATVGAFLRRAERRLFTLTGPGGVGKTRLAIAVATGAADDFPDGVWLAPLAPIRDALLVDSTVARSLGIQESAETPAIHQLTAFLEPKHLLLVLDNFEHVVVSAPFVAEILNACPSVSILVTSRVALHISGEQEYAVAPLGVVEADAAFGVDTVATSSSAQLFVDRAQAVRLDFALTAANAWDVAEICRSRRTVTTHVSHLYAKLGVASRAEAIALAFQERLF